MRWLGRQRTTVSLEEAVAEVAAEEPPKVTRRTPLPVLRPALPATFTRPLASVRAPCDRQR